METHNPHPVHKVISLISMVMLVMVMNACYNDFHIPQPVVVTQEVSFSTDILPIFSAKCSTTTCHDAAGISPKLTASTAYNALINGGYINTDTPENSELYQWMTGNRSTPMPPSGVNSSDNALILAWITQGALNN